jgi:polar amino acid transport system substrate-binding protein
MKLSRAVMFAVAAAAMMATSGPAMADIKFGVAAEPYPPFTSKDASGKWVGWEVDLMDALCAQITEKCEIVEVAWDGIIPALQSKQFDLIWSSMTITAERKQTIDFSNMYYGPSAAIIGAKTGDLDIAPAHLSGKTIGAQVSTIHQKYVDKYYGVAGATVKTYQTQDEANQDLASGRLDYVQADGAALDAFLKTEQGSSCCELKGKVAPDPEVLGEGVGAGIRKEDTALKDKVNAGLAELVKAGKLAEITEKYPDLKQQIILPQ